jgi:hypothetical protein
MPTGQNYATNVPQTTLTGLINPTAPVCSVFSSSGWPPTPFTAIFDIGTSSQEPVDVTNITGTTWTITRAIDGTVGMTHGVGATITHGDIGRDFREARAHIDASTSNDAAGHSVHGLAVSSSVVGTTDTQTLSNKTIASGTYTGTQAMGSGNWGGSGILTETALGVSGLSSLGSSRFVGQTAAGPPSAGTFATGDYAVDTTYGLVWICIGGGTPGTWTAGNGRVLLAGISPGATSSTSFGSAQLNLPAGTSNFNHLEIHYNAQMNGAAATGPTAIFMQLNGISTASYNWTRITFNNGGALGTAGADAATSAGVGLVWNSNTGTPTNGQGVGVITLNNRSGAPAWKRAWEAKAGGGDGTTANTQMLSTFSGSINSTAAITSLAFATTTAGNWSSGTTFDVYGLV